MTLFNELVQISDKNKAVISKRENSRPYDHNEIESQIVNRLLTEIDWIAEMRQAATQGFRGICIVFFPLFTLSNVKLLKEHLFLLLGNLLQRMRCDHHIHDNKLPIIIWNTPWHLNCTWDLNHDRQLFYSKYSYDKTFLYLKNIKVTNLLDLNYPELEQHY